MKNIFIVLFSAFLMFALLVKCNQAQATPFVVSDSTTQTVTHCGILLDSNAKVEVPVVTVTPTTAICKYDVGNVSVGQHTIKATFINVDPLWGRNESVQSAPFDFIRPGAGTITSPSGLGLSK